MSESVITVENLSKRYIIGHQRQGRNYLTLRDSVADAVRGFARTLFKGNAAAEADGTREEFWALKDVSFEVKRGECIGIIGRNGAGKSTLLKILSRITEPTQGSIRLKGRVASLLEVGTGFHPELTGRENIFLNGAILGMKREEIKRKFDEIVAFAEVEKFLDTPVKHYSSGMYMRLAFAVAAHLVTEILIVDEVLAVGDSEFQKKCMGKMSEATKAGRTVLFVSHNLAAISYFCSSALLLNSGCVHALGEVSNVVREYSHLNSNKRKISVPKDAATRKAYITDFYVETVSPNSNSVVIPELRFILSAVVNVKVQNLTAGIGIDDLYGRRLITLYSKFYDVSFTLEPGAHRLLCIVKSLALRSGCYIAKLILTDSHEIIHHVDESLECELNTSNMYPGGIVPNEAQGYFVAEQQWSKID